MGCFSWLLLAPLSIAFFITTAIANASVKKGHRLIGVLFSLAIGGLCIYVGYLLAIEGFLEWQGLELYKVTYPVLGWIMMIGEGSMAAIGTYTSLFATKEEIELRENKNKEDVQDESFK